MTAIINLSSYVPLIIHPSREEYCDGCVCHVTCIPQ